MVARIRCLWLCVGGLSGATLFADLDVGIPPGTPLEWRFELPFHQPDAHRGPIYTKGPAKKKEAPEPKAPRGRTVVYVPKVVVPPAPPARFGGFNPMGAARILTLDMARELPWTSWKGRDSLPRELAYPPRTRVDLHWLCISALLRQVMHPARISHAETAQYLITIGPPVLDTLKNSQSGLGAESSLLKYLRRNIPATPSKPPDTRPLLRGVESPELRMLIKWATRELVSDHPYAYNPLYARRTLSLGGEAVPVLLACVQSRHALLRENACGILAAYNRQDEEIMVALRTQSRGKDPVARNRALEALVALRDKETEKFLLKTLKSSDRRLRVHAVAALGRMGSVAARKEIRRSIRRSTQDRGDSWLTAALALSRLSDADGASRKLLARLKKLVRRLGTKLAYPGTGVNPDIPDRPQDRAELLVETITLAMARLGDRKARDEIFATLNHPADQGRADRRGRRRFNDPVLGGIEPINQLLAIETLATMGGGEAREILRKVVSKSADIVVRGFAFEHLMRGGRSDDFVLSTAEKESMPTVLRVQAMKALARASGTREQALAVAASMVEDYLTSKKSRSLKRGTDRVASYACLAAIKLRGRHGSQSLGQLRDVLDTARARGDYERLESAKSAKEAQRRGPGGSDQISLRAFPALYEAAVVELGRAHDIRAVEVLRPILADEDGPGRAEAALALGNYRTRETCDTLIATLEDGDPWVRYCAYRALRQVSSPPGGGGGQSASHGAFFADWLFGDKTARARAVRAWKGWRKESGAKLPAAAGLIAEREAAAAKKREEEAAAKKEEEASKKATSE